MQDCKVSQMARQELCSMVTPTWYPTICCCHNTSSRHFQNPGHQRSFNKDWEKRLDAPASIDTHLMSPHFSEYRTRAHIRIPHEAMYLPAIRRMAFANPQVSCKQQRPPYTTITGKREERNIKKKIGPIGHVCFRITRFRKSWLVITNRNISPKYSSDNKSEAFTVIKSWKKGHFKAM